MASAITSPVRFMGTDLTAFSNESLPGTRFAAGEQPIDKTAGNASGGEHLALAHEWATGVAVIAGEIETVAQRQRQHAAKRRVNQAPARGPAAPASWQSRRSRRRRP